MEDREYYAIRKGFTKFEDISPQMFKKAFLLVYRNLFDAGYFQKYFGNDCTDGRIDGILGNDISTAIFLKVGKAYDWPIFSHIDSYSDVDIFTMIEILHDCCSKPIDSHYHNWNDCGIHVTKADDDSGRKEFRDVINPILKKFRNLEISPKGEILECTEEGFEAIYAAPIPTNDEDNIKKKISAAIIKFRRATANLDERRDALRDLADVLEYLKPQIKGVLMNKDTNELFEIANTFGIRHHNVRQKTDYDKPIWHSWIFYCYLSTVHLCLRLIEQQKKS
ncbi:hypothetical protein DVR12_21120 [Chitinophaga silvatica]|uniref:Uncharacterized protein n=1 Tax=Chitinophaga silvatica TaxID=2282649 RepID=A0A3E1Y647_9BACT|nr:hypothetical protein [Chitinophaga silvatica]RFS20218.1 hypothetical protein DVR12_21120 [Chitinophaga silvatica]